jgi:hypothetical protein
MIGANSKPTSATNVNDFAAYWSAASLIIHSHNPYAGHAVLSLENEVGFTGSTPLIMRNPPWIMPIIAPLGFLSFGLAQRLWLIVGLLAILISAKWLWDLYRVERQSRVLTCLAVATFSPLPVALAIGQVSPLVLLGIAGFLHFEDKQKLGWAGAFLFLATLKPHLIFLVWVALASLSIYHRTARIVGALMLAIVIASFIAISLDHSIFVQYAQMLVKERVPQELTPTVSGIVRLWSGIYAAEFLPGVLALGGLLFYGGRRWVRWNWAEGMPLLVVISLLTTPYGWFFDQVILLPCLFQAASWLATSRQSPLRVGVMTVYLSANATVLTLIRLHLTTFWYVWTISVWFALYALTQINRPPLPNRTAPSQ